MSGRTNGRELDMNVHVARLMVDAFSPLSTLAQETFLLRLSWTSDAT